MATSRCAHCGAPATHSVEAGRPGTDHWGNEHTWRHEHACAQHLERARRWAAKAGPVTVRRIADDPQLSMFGEGGVA